MLCSFLFSELALTYFLGLTLLIDIPITLLPWYERHLHFLNIINVNNCHSALLSVQWYQCQHLACWLYPRTCSPFVCYSVCLNLALHCDVTELIESNLLSLKTAYEDPKCQKLSRILASQMHCLTALQMLKETSRRHQWHNVFIQNLYQQIRVFALGVRHKCWLFHFANHIIKIFLFELLPFTSPQIFQFWPS